VLAATTFEDLTDIPAGWTFTTGTTGSTMAVEDGYLKLRPGANGDTVTHSSTTDNSTRISTALENHGGDVDVAVEWARDVGDRRGFTNFLGIHGSSNTLGHGRISIYKAADDNEFPFCFWVNRHATGSGTAGFNQSVNGWAVGDRQMTLTAPFTRLRYVAATAMLYGYVSTDGVHWLQVTTERATAFTPVNIRVGFCVTTGGRFSDAEMKVLGIYDLIALGTTDLRRPLPEKIRDPLLTFSPVSGDVALPSGLVDKSTGSQAPGEFISGAYRLKDAGTDNANAAGWGMLVTNFEELDQDGGMLVRMRCNNPNSSFFATLGLTHDLGDPPTYTVTSVTRTSNVSVATIGAHTIRLGEVITVAGVTDSSFNAAGATVTAVGATTVTYANTGSNGTSSGGTCKKPHALDQYVRGPGHGLEVQLGPIRRPIEVDWSADTDSFSDISSTGLREQPYGHEFQHLAEPSFTNSYRMFRLERLRDPDGPWQRYRVKEWASVGTLQEDKDAEPEAYNLFDGQASIRLEPFGFTVSLSHNGTEGSATVRSLDVSHWEMYALVDDVPDPPDPPDPPADWYHPSDVTGWSLVYYAEERDRAYNRPTRDFFLTEADAQEAIIRLAPGQLIEVRGPGA
jgi:hypothetical protein